MTTNPNDGKTPVLDIECVCLMNGRHAISEHGATSEWYDTHYFVTDISNPMHSPKLVEGHAPDCDNIIFGRECDCNWPQFTDAAGAFASAAYHLQTVWNNIASDGDHPLLQVDAYPFSESFDELAPRIAAWIEATEAWIMANNTKRKEDEDHGEQVGDVFVIDDDSATLERL